MNFPFISRGRRARFFLAFDLRKRRRSARRNGGAAPDPAAGSTDSSSILCISPLQLPDFFPLVVVPPIPRSDSKRQIAPDKMKHILKILGLLAAISAFWIGLINSSFIPYNYVWLLPIYLIVSLGCYGLLMVGVGLMVFPTCPQEANLLQMDIIEAKDFLMRNGVDVGAA